MTPKPYILAVSSKYRFCRYISRAYAHRVNIFLIIIENRSYYHILNLEAPLIPCRVLVFVNAPSGLIL